MNKNNIHDGNNDKRDTKDNNVYNDNNNDKH